MPGISSSNSFCISSVSFSLLSPGRPLVERLERHEQLDIRKGRGVGAVVGTPVLRNDGDHFRVPEQNLSHLARRLGAGIERDGRRHLRSDPEIALLQRRKKFRAKPRRDENADNQEYQPAANRQLGVVQRPAQSGRIGLAQLAHDPGLDLLDMLREHERRENRRHREGRGESAKQRIGIGAGHGAEDLSFDAGHREQAAKGGDGDRRGEKHRLIDLQRADENQPQPISPGRGVIDALRTCRVAAELAFGEMVEQRSPFLLGRLKIAEICSRRESPPNRR